MTISLTLSSNIDVIVGPELIERLSYKHYFLLLTSYEILCELHDYLTNIIIYYRRHIRSCVNYTTILLTLSSTIDVILGPGLIT
jgi:hypothetical protein